MQLDTRDVAWPLRVGEYELTFERYDHPDEARLITATDDASRATYSDWLEQRGEVTRASSRAA